MKKILFSLLLSLNLGIAFGQLNAPSNPVPDKPVLNESLVVQLRSRKVEVLAGLRATKLSNGKYQLFNSEAAYTKDIYGVAYDHTQKAYVFLTGEISFKLLSGYDLSSLASTISLRSKLIAPPNTYVLTVNYPSELVSLFNLLKSNPITEWVEIYTLQGAVSP